MIKPLFKHDCPHCKFLKTYLRHDLYFCDYGHQSIIARYGDEPHANKSGLAFADHDKHLHKAQFLAIKRGYL